jgi:NAD(P)-dependent dehydrogenase (short-subunit alcohol dehydrogenase family)
MLEKNIRVNAVSPGPIKTPIIGRHADEKAVRKTWDYLASVIPMKRMGEAEEVAKAVLFLSSDDSSFTTGTELQVDGGRVDLV